MEVNPRVYVSVSVCVRQALPVEPPSNLFPYVDCRVEKGIVFLGLVAFLYTFPPLHSHTFGTLCTFAIPEESDSKIQELE